MFLDGSDLCNKRIKNMIFFDVNNGIARRSWAKNANALLAINKEMKKTPKLKVTIPENVNTSILDSLF